MYLGRKFLVCCLLWGIGVGGAWGQTYVQPHTMAWQPPNPNSSEVPDEYCIYRSVNGGSFTQLACIAATNLSYTDSALTFGNRYCYKAKSKKGANESTDFSQGFCVSALPTTGR